MTDFTIDSFNDFKTYCSQGTNQIQSKVIGIPGESYELFYLHQLTNKDILHRDILHPLLELGGGFGPDELLAYLPVGAGKKICEWGELPSLLLAGWVYVHPAGYERGVILQADQIPGRSLTSAENESQIFGPQVSFAESIDQNMALIRSIINDPLLKTELFTIGNQTKTRTIMCYMEGLNNNAYAEMVRKRLSNLKTDGILDSGMLAKMLEDNPDSIFPMYFLTERPDRTVGSLLEGKVIVLVGGSPRALIGPSTFIDFFKAEEDRYVHWQMSAFVFILRMLAVFFSMLLTPLYVAALTFHYEMIPSALLDPLSSSRSKVPFPPLFEALLLEFIIELLREAGARLPTKVGQTMGIVGGIVIGQAAVQAGFTSNLLIMIVALGALASFTSPGFMMGTAIRILRFPMILIAGFWGGVGIVIGVSFLIIHLMRLTSLGTPYLKPFYPFDNSEFTELFIRRPYGKFMDNLIRLFSFQGWKKKGDNAETPDNRQNIDLFEQFQEEN
ncbi:spore germination protein [Paenibacillus chitinolyticus]|uniref:spore germination protein n=1 Tax=Paenibacillus chitinolyticus TaxID=79263 RepID=UPI003D090400